MFFLKDNINTQQNLKVLKCVRRKHKQRLCYHMEIIMNSNALITMGASQKVDIE